jgi:hypothetical protein
LLRVAVDGGLVLWYVRHRFLLNANGEGVCWESVLAGEF